MDLRLRVRRERLEIRRSVACELCEQCTTPAQGLSAQSVATAYCYKKLDVGKMKKWGQLDMKYDSSEIIIFQTEDGQTKIDVRMDDDTVWLTQAQMTELFQTTKQNVSLHINNAFKEGEIEENSTVKEYLTVQNEGNRVINRKVKYYSLDVIISIGYRVKSLRGTQFRRWAIEILKEYLQMGTYTICQLFC